MNGYQCYVQPTGDIIVCDGVVFHESAGVLKLAGSGGAFSATFQPVSDSPFRMVSSAAGTTFVGGSGRNLTCTGLPSVPSSAATPTGWYKPGVAGTFSNGLFTATVTGSSAASISDDTNVVAILTTGGTAPVGNYASTTYGKNTYGEIVATVRQPFTLAVAAEIAGGGSPPNAFAESPAAAFPGGTFTALSVALYQCDLNTDWTIVVAPSGSAELRYLTDVIAERAAGSGYDPSGECLSTTLGREFMPITPGEAGAPTGDEMDVNPFGILTLTFSWTAEVDLETRVEFLDGVVGEGVALADYMTWGGTDPVGPPGDEVVTIDLATAWDDGLIFGAADVFCFADWNPAVTPTPGKGPALLDVSYSLAGSVFSGTIRPGQAGPVTTAVRSFRVLSDGTVLTYDREWTATMKIVPRLPRVGVAYLELVRVAGVLNQVNGPFFATSMPAPSGGTSYTPLAICDGFGMEQLHTGMLVI